MIQIRRPMPKWPLTGRSTILLFFGIAWAGVGYAILSTPTPALHATVATNLAPLNFWGWVWVFCGVLAIVTGVLRWIKWLGFGALMFISFLWTLVEFADWLTGNSKLGLVFGIVFGCLCLAIGTSAGMVDGPRRGGTPRKED